MVFTTWQFSPIAQNRSAAVSQISFINATITAAVALPLIGKALTAMNSKADASHCLLTEFMVFPIARQPSRGHSSDTPSSRVSFRMEQSMARETGTGRRFRLVPDPAAHAPLIEIIKTRRNNPWATAATADFAMRRCFQQLRRRLPALIPWCVMRAPPPPPPPTCSVTSQKKKWDLTLIGRHTFRLPRPAHDLSVRRKPAGVASSFAIPSTTVRSTPQEEKALEHLIQSFSLLPWMLPCRVKQIAMLTSGFLINWQENAQLNLSLKSSACRTRCSAWVSS